MSQETKQSKRRWLRFSLRTFLIVLTISCVWLGWYLYRVEQQREAVKWVRENGGTVYYDYEFGDDNGFLDESQPAVPKWLLDLLGVDYFSTVTHGKTFNTELSDITPLATLKNLRSLNLGGTQVSDVAPLVGLTNLEYLVLDHTQVSDVTPLAGLTNLEILMLNYNTPVSDVTPLAGLTNLEHLWLDHTQVSDLTPLAGLTNLKHLDLRNTKVTDEDFEKLKQALPNCNILH